MEKHWLLDIEFATYGKNWIAQPFDCHLSSIMKFKGTCHIELGMEWILLYDVVDVWTSKMKKMKI